MRRDALDHGVILCCWVVMTSQKLVHKPIKFYLPAALIPSCLLKAFLGPQLSAGVKVFFCFQLESLPGQCVPISYNYFI